MNNKHYRVEPWVDDEGNVVDPVEQLPSRTFGMKRMEERIQEWVEADAQGELQVHIKGYPQVTAQVLIRRRLLEEVKWEDLSGEYGITVPTLSAFYQRQCAPKLRDFGNQLRATGEDEQYL